MRWDRAGATINAVHPGVVRTNLGAMSGIKGAILKAMNQAVELSGVRL